MSLPPTLVTLTGTGVPLPAPGRAGPGTLVRYGDVALQFDAGRATVLRLTEADAPPHALTALFVTHVHSDHVVGLADIVLTRWLFHDLHAATPLPIVASEGAAARFVRRMLEAYDDDVALRIAHVQPEPPSVDLRTFDAPPEPARVWESDDAAVTVDAVAVHHEPVTGAVAYRVTTPSGVVVISGDTRVCDEVEQLSVGADLLVHEACRTTAMRGAIAGTSFETIFSYHADTVPLGALAQRAAVPHLLLSHLIPPPSGDAEADAFAADVRDGGYTGRVTVGEDLTTVSIGPAS
ncbi:MAG: MBL fold metallo-hydrolase [Acidimicrobiia bacterium]|nr:MBL fold metallo-hydrolase [Acidimicrobiia bacterium]